ncbi:hypothetical protein PUV54_03620 [Hyphococcus flavus]|uniref:Uncharacterized protein n=1 Tax=Hyphococcus flavus TaxID=1866326 RepID=A0AAF0CGE6_9PROT|nr:hypothetical protein [Hyphococcus flavus]WDI32279.1 hypothetical protein PUV54_03620 [Hyphococcus flavus]
MMLRIISVCVAACLFASPAAAQELEGDYLYRVETIRAAPGKLEALLEWAARAREDNYFEDAGGSFPLIMRHSQGDQWDLLVILPMESWVDFHTKARQKKRQDATRKHEILLASQDGLIAFEEDHFAYGPPYNEVKSAYDSNAYFHIEMFNAAPGKSGELLEQRRMENAYLEQTGQTPNMIFRRAAGSDVDIFTIGFHESRLSYASQAPHDEEAAEDIAKDVGFKDRADISFYLRSLISGHHDTFAVKVE